MQTTSSLKAYRKLRRVDFVSMVLFLGSISGGRLCINALQFPWLYFMNVLLDPNETPTTRINGIHAVKYLPLLLWHK